MHVPVLIKETISLLALKPGDRVIDATVGDGGHAEGILDRISPGGVFIGIDRDPEMLERARRRLVRHEAHIHLVAAPFTEISAVAHSFGSNAVNAILFDLGLASWHLEESGRGFSFMRSQEPLDMRFDQNGISITASDLLNRGDVQELARIVTVFGEISNAKRFARRVVEARARSPLRKVGDLVAIVKRISHTPHIERYLAQVFQALRIAVNKELDALETTLPDALHLLETGGRIAIISYHSLEDRIVKQFFNREALHNNVTLITKKPLVPLEQEVQANSRARSAKLRVAQKL